MVAGGHRTEMPVNSVYSGVVTLAGVRIVTFLAKHNDMELWGTDIGNVYLESYTKEKVCFTVHSRTRVWGAGRANLRHQEGTLRPPIQWGMMA
jgi:hypothetical protein